METLKTIWDFFQNEVLGMNWLNRLIETFLNACGLDTTGKIGGSVQFFIYDTVKIMVLLGVLILIISYIQSYFPPERAKKILGRFHGIWANIIAALLGTVTPFCSCSSIPLFIGFTSAGLPLGVTFSFLISSPMVDLGSLVLLMSIFGWKVAVLYVIFGLVIAVAGGTLIEKLHLDNQVEEYIRNGHSIDVPQEELHFKDRMKFAWEQVVETAKKVAPYVLIGVGIGAFIHNWIPEEFIVKALGENNPFGVILATIVGIPMYADIFGTIPIAEALLAKGALLGVVLSFMMGVTTLSLPSMIMLRKAVKPKLLGIFIGICAAGIIIVPPAELLCKVREYLLRLVLRIDFGQGDNQFPCFDTFALCAAALKLLLAFPCKVAPKGAVGGAVGGIEIFLPCMACNIRYSPFDIGQF